MAYDVSYQAQWRLLIGFPLLIIIPRWESKAEPWLEMSQAWCQGHETRNCSFCHCLQEKTRQCVGWFQNVQKYPLRCLVLTRSCKELYTSNIIYVYVYVYIYIYRESIDVLCAYVNNRIPCGNETRASAYSHLHQQWEFPLPPGRDISPCIDDCPMKKISFLG